MFGAGGLLKGTSKGISAGVDLTENLIAHYLLNNNADDSFGTFDGTPTTVDFQGDVGAFNGTTSYAVNSNLTNELFKQEFTISVWAKANQSNVDSGVIQAQDTLNTNYPYLFLRFASDSTIQTILRTNSLDMLSESTYTYTVDTLYHFVFMVTATGAKVFINGVEEYTATFTPVFTTNSSASFNIGRFSQDWVPTDGSYHNGNISNVRIYSDAKDQTFIEELYAEGYYPKPLPPPTTVGLIAHYPLTGTAEDTTGNYDGVEVGNTYVDDAESGSVANFNGTSSNINSGFSFPVNQDSYSMSAWVRLDTSAGNYNSILSNGYYVNNSDTRGFNFGANYADLYPYVRLQNDSYTYKVTSDTEIVKGELFHISFVKNGLNVKLYLNNVQVGEETNATGLDAYTRDYIIGGYTDDDPLILYYFDGEISKLRIYNTALTQQEITDIYNYEKNFRSIDIDDGLIAYYPLKNNSLDNYYNEYDATDDAGVTYNGSQATLPSGDNVTFPSATGFVEAYYTTDDVVTKTVTETDLNNLTDCTLSEVRKYSSALDTDQQGIIGYTP